MSEPFTFYRALDPVKGSWDGYGYFPLGESDFLAFVADAPSGASIHTPELIKNFWNDFAKSWVASDPDQNRIELVDKVNYLQSYLQKKGRQDGSLYQATLSLALKVGAKLLYCSIGDSVLQLFRNDKLYRLTANEVWDGALVVEANQQLKERQKTQTLLFLGNGGEFLKPSDISSTELRSDDVLIFCTDGIEDLLSPAQLIPLLKTNPEAMRKEFERIFAQDRLQDDATFLALKLKVPVGFQTETEFGRLKSQVEGLQKEQVHFRTDLARVSSATRMDRMEKTLQDIAMQVQNLGRKLDHARPRESFTTIRQKSTAQWPFLLIAFVAGLTAAAAFFLFIKAPRSLQTVPSTAKATKPVVTAAPPEILPTRECNYVVQKGDSLDKIAVKNNLTLDHLLAWNPTVKKGSALQVGQKLNLCGETP